MLWTRLSVFKSTSYFPSWMKAKYDFCFLQKDGLQHLQRSVWIWKTDHMTSSQNNRICDTLSYFAQKKCKRISSILTTVHPYLILFIKFHFHRVFKIGISLLLKCKITCTNFELFVHGALLSTALFRYKHIETTGIVCIVFKYLTRPKGLLAYFSIKTTNLFDPVFLTR